MKIYTKAQSFSDRQRSGFLWFPKEANGILRWLETAKWRETFITMPTNEGIWLFGHPRGKWLIQDWIDIPKGE